MGLFDFLFGGTPEKYEKKGDSYFKKDLFGQAKIEYERGKSRHCVKPSEDRTYGDRIAVKIQDTCEALAIQHLTRGKELVEAHCIQDARELFILALELTDDETLVFELEQMMLETAPDKISGIQLSEEEDMSSDEKSLNEMKMFEDSLEESADVYAQEFEALCSTLPDMERKAYHSYGEYFIKGFVELNQGRFDSAAHNLATALGMQMDDNNYIPLELATCYLNLDEYQMVVDLMGPFLNRYPESLKGYEILCEAFWAMGEFIKAEALLNGCSEKIADSMLIHLLRGETLFQENRYDDAEDYYKALIEEKGREDLLLRALAKTVEAKGNPKAAKEIYKELISACKGCRKRPDFHLRLGLADTSFASADYSDQLVDLYLNLAREDPKHKSEYYEKVSTIYAELGNLFESQRYKSFIEKL